MSQRQGGRGPPAAKQPAGSTGLRGVCVSAALLRAFCSGGLGYPLHSGTPRTLHCASPSPTPSSQPTPSPLPPTLYPSPPPHTPSPCLAPALQKTAEELAGRLHEENSKSIAEFYPGQGWDVEYSDKVVKYLISKEVSTGSTLDAASQGRIEEKYARIAKRVDPMPTEADMVGEGWETVDKDKKSKPQHPPPSSRDARPARPAV